MAQTRLEIEPEVQAVLDHVDNRRNFLLSGGAGSGKTYSLVQVIRHLLSEEPFAKVACMTYTNAAVRQIENRVDHPNLTVSTIHDFLWDNIKHFQKEIKVCLIELLNNEEANLFNIDDRTDIPTDFFDSLEEGIQYKEFIRLKEGIVSHDEVLVIANKLFEKYPKISDIVKDKYAYIFIDEYQDTSKHVVDIFLTQFKKSAKANIIGFFGDAMQSIYDDTIGNLDDYKGDLPEQVAEVKKSQNRRNPRKVIDLANLLRTDGIVQVASADMNAPNMVAGALKEGSIKFIYSNHSDFGRIRTFLRDDLDWPIDDVEKTKELNLTHNLIADKAEFRSLMDIYDKDQIIAYRRRIREYIKNQGITDDFSTFTFGQVIAHLKQGNSGAALKPIDPTPMMMTFIVEHPDLMAIALDYNYAEFSKIYIDPDQLIDDKKQAQEEESRKGSKRDNLIKHLFKIENSISLYANKQYHEFLKATDFRTRIYRIKDKETLKENIEALTNVGNKTIKEIISEANELGICLIDEPLEKFKREKTYLYDRVKAIQYKEFQKLYAYLQGHTPFSTQHKTKGSEFDTVLVILDNGGWNKYNFSNLFLKEGNPTVLARTQKIFYVCCTRAMENLAVFFHNPSPAVIEAAKAWFGSDNVINV